MEKQFTNELNKEIILTHTLTARRLLSFGKTGTDAFTLYNFYCFCSSLQETNQVYALDTFCIKGLHWGRDRFRGAKNLLLEQKIVENVVKRNKGKIIGHYIHIHYLARGIKNHKVVEPTSGFQKTNALDKESNTLDKKEILSIFDFWNEKNIVNHRKLTDKMKRKIKSALKDYKLEEIKKAIDKYNVVLKDEKYFWTYRWTLPDFLARGLEKFLDTPAENFLTQKNQQDFSPLLYGD